MQSQLGENRTQKGFVRVPNEILNNPSLSFGAKGLWAYMASKPEGWRFTIRLIATQSKDSRDAVASRLKELLDAHLVTRKDEWTPHGRVCLYSIFNEARTENTDEANRDLARTDLANKQNPSLQYSNTELSKKEWSKTERTKERKKQGTYDEIFEKMEVSDKLKEAFVEFIKFRKLAKSPMTDKAIELAIKKVRKLASTEPEQVAIIEQSIERGWKGLFPLKENDNPQSRAVPETQVRPLDVSEAMTQNPNVKKLFDLWEDCFGIRPLETAENIVAIEALLDRFRDKATWLIGGLARSKNDNYVPKEFSTIATPSDLWKKSDLMWNYILNHKDEWKKADEFQAAFN